MNTVIRAQLSENDQRQVYALTHDLPREYDSAADPRFLDQAALIAHGLPLSVRRAINEMRVKEPNSGLCIISGFPVDFERIGQTPTHWKNREQTGQAAQEEFYLVLIGSLLGDVFAWATQQDGRLVHDVLPIREHENDQLGCGSRELLWWHSEDAFHPYRADYLGLMCLRNPDRVATTVSWLEPSDLDDHLRHVLSQKRFCILPDESHLEKNRGEAATNGAGTQLENAYRHINEMRSSPSKVAVLSGAGNGHYLRLDPYFMPPLDGDPEAQAALDALTHAIAGRLQDVVLEPGDTCIIDNYKAVHGRKSFTARYDGNDRWLKRINVTRDLRKSSEARMNGSRAIL
jgi:Fe(II)/alpha-ketoglutarate-dependent arginine beta-hydroxylase